MNIEQVRNYTLSLYGVTEDQPFGDDIITFRQKFHFLRSAAAQAFTAAERMECSGKLRTAGI